jgi:hypothetical protein
MKSKFPIMFYLNWIFKPILKMATSPKKRNTKSRKDKILTRMKKLWIMIKNIGNKITETES